MYHFVFTDVYLIHVYTMKSTLYFSIVEVNMLILDSGKSIYGFMVILCHRIFLVFI